MAFTPISNTVPQYEENGVAASGYFIKLYESGTTTPTAMATDSTGTTLLDKCELNTEGYPINGSSAVFIPHINKKYKIALFRNAADADANDLNNAAWDVDGLLPYFTDSSIGTAFDQIPLNADIVYPVESVQGLAGLIGAQYNQQVSVIGYHANTKVGGGRFSYKTGRHNGGTFIDPNRAFPTDWTDQGQLTAWFADSGVDVDGWERSYSGSLYVSWFGGQPYNLVDDTIPLQKAIDVHYLGKRELMIDGAYLCKSALTATPFMNLRGFSSEKQPPFTDAGLRPSELINTGTDLFTGIGKIEGSLSGIVFRNSATPVEDGFFMNVPTFAGSLKNCLIANYGYLFNALSNADIKDNTIIGVRKEAFAACYDTRIAGNYINGAAASGFNATCFVVVSTTVVSGNYIDFFKAIFGRNADNTSGGIGGSSINNNILERCYRIFDFDTPAAPGRVALTTISDNIIRYCDEAGTKAYFTSPDTDMDTLPWGGMFFYGFNRGSIEGNAFSVVDSSSVFNGFPFYNFTYTGNGEDTSVINTVSYDVQYGGAAHEHKNIYIDALDKKVFATLPSPTLTGASIVTFDKQQAYHANKLATNIAGVWYYADGTAA